MDKSTRLTVCSFAFNTAFSIHHLVFGIISNSWWLLVLGSYYMILSILRLFLLCAKKSGGTTTKFTGILLMISALPLAGTVILSVVRDRGYQLHMILMIAMAAYAFTKITLATVQLAKSRRTSPAALHALRNISFVEALVSIFALQRSMLVSFEGMYTREVQLMNALVGSGVCILVFLLGLNLVRSKNASAFQNKK